MPRIQDLPIEAVQKCDDSTVQVVWAVAKAILNHLFDVVGDTLLFMKKPAAALLALVSSTSVIVLIVSLAFERARSGVCEWPVLSALPFCPSNARDANPFTHADFPGLVAVQHKALDEFMGYSDTGLGLAVNLKQAEIAVQDLIILVKASDLAIKDILADALREFVADAKMAGWGLQLLSSKIYGTVDKSVPTCPSPVLPTQY